MRIHLSSDEVNLLVHRYLLENGFLHSAFAFSAEAAISKNPFHATHAEKLPPNALVTLLQKALLFIYVEFHTEDETGRAIPCDEAFSFFKRHECWTRREGSEDVASASGLLASLAEGAATPRYAPAAASPSHLVKNSEGGGPESASNDLDFLAGSILADDERAERVERPSAVRGKRGAGGCGATGAWNRGGGPRGKKRARIQYRGAAGPGVDLPDALAGSSHNAGSSPVEEEDRKEAAQEAEAGVLSGRREDEEESEDAPPGALARAAPGEDIIYEGPPAHACEEKVALKNFLRLLPGHDGDAGALSEWSPADPCLIVTNFAAGVPWLYRLPSVEIVGPGVLAPFRELEGPCVGGALNPGSSAHWKRDGELVATGYESGDVRVWRPLETSCVASLSVSSTSVICTAFSCEGTYLAAACADGSVVVWQLRRDKTAECGEKVGAGREKDRSAAADSKSEETNGGGRDSEASNSAISFVKVHAYRHRGGVIDLDWTRDSVIASGSVDGCVVVSDLPKRVCHWVSLGAVSPRAGTATLRVFVENAAADANRQQEKVETAAGEDSPTAPKARREEKRDKDDGADPMGELPVFPEQPAEEQSDEKGEDARKADGLKAADAVEGSDAEVASLRWNGDGTFLAIVDSSPVVKLWQLDDPPAPLIELAAHAEPVIKAEWRNGGRDDNERFLVTAAMDRQLFLWDLEKSRTEPAKTIVYKYPPTSLRISGDGSRLAVGTYDSVVHIYALPSLTEVASLIDPHMVIPHITWRSTHDSIAYNVFNMGRTIVAKAEEKPGAAKLEDSV
ncbi:transducin beta-like protein TBL1 [Toxoplasma gondii CAST]|uniref:Transducin beta-like protein TBL1 n=1 Tax=Toxoplasma gondii CAST TaxID=943122 RepID=A0A3R8ARE8_TOXGO|nr:transducin beta-like protein TBL1 [Toxoplasma gondii CAST]